MARVKSDFRSQLSRSRLSACFRISEEGKSIDEYNPDAAIELWYTEKVRRLDLRHINTPKEKPLKALK